MSNIQLVMVRNSLDNLPDLNIPAGYKLETINEDKKSDWEKIIKVSFNKEFDFEEHMESEAWYNPERVFFISHKIKGNIIINMDGCIW